MPVEEQERVRAICWREHRIEARYKRKKLAGMPEEKEKQEE